MEQLLCLGNYLEAEGNKGIDGVVLFLKKDFGVICGVIRSDELNTNSGTRLASYRHG